MDMRAICILLIIVLGMKSVFIIYKCFKSAFDSSAFYRTLISLSANLLMMISAIFAILGYMLVNKFMLDSIEHIDKLGSMFIAVGATIFASVLSNVLNIYDFLKRKGWIKRYLVIFVVLTIIAVIICIFCLDSYMAISELMILVIGIIMTLMFDCGKKIDEEDQGTIEVKDEETSE